MLAKKALILFLVIGAISCDESKMKAPTEDISVVPLLGSLLNTVEQIVNKLNEQLIIKGEKLAELVEKPLVAVIDSVTQTIEELSNTDKQGESAEKPAAAVVNSVDENIEDITNSSKVNRRDVGKDITKNFKDNKYYNKKYAGKYIKNIGKKIELKREDYDVVNEAKLEQLKALADLKDRAENEMTALLGKFGKQLNDFTSSFVQKSPWQLVQEEVQKDY